MKVILKKPKMDPEVIDVENICAINKLVGNLDDLGNGLKTVGSDTRMLIAPGIDMYTKDDANFNQSLEANIWTEDGFGLICGSIVFAGYNKGVVCSLTEKQIKKCISFIEKYKYLGPDEN